MTECLLPSRRDVRPAPPRLSQWVVTTPSRHPPFLPPPASLSRYEPSPLLQASPTTVGISTITGARGRSRPAAEGLLPLRRDVRTVPLPVQVYGWTYLYNWAENDTIVAGHSHALGRCCTTTARDSGDAHTHVGTTTKDRRRQLYRPSSSSNPP